MNFNFNESINQIKSILMNSNALFGFDSEAQSGLVSIVWKSCIIYNAKRNRLKTFYIINFKRKSSCVVSTYFTRKEEGNLSLIDCSELIQKYYDFKIWQINKRGVNGPLVNHKEINSLIFLNSKGHLVFLVILIAVISYLELLPPHSLHFLYFKPSNQQWCMTLTLPEVEQTISEIPYKRKISYLNSNYSLQLCN